MEKNILGKDDINKYNRNNKGLGNTAYNYSLKSCELIISGRIEEFYIFKKFHQDLLFCCYEDNKADFLQIINIVIDPEKQKKINEFCEINLTPIEKLVYHLIYCENLNLYEVAAPV
ncbi:hypothetical protein [Viridibacillus arvi]|uniref:hypothetical protein n=1 Tax=Viridibacillus arvi TaxID=263475 RepID=UPI003CFEF67E